MGAVAVRVSRPAAVLLAPVLSGQGRRVRRETPVLPEAVGVRHGVEAPERPTEDTPLLVGVLGESTAAGVGIQRIEDGLARHLARELAARTGREVRWTVSARTGATAAYAREALLLPLLDRPNDLDVIVLGVNDTLRLAGRRTWRRRVGRLLEALQHRQPTGRVLLAGVPDLGTFPALPQPLRTVLGWHARALDRELRTLADDTPNVLHAAVPPLGGGGPELFASDGFHPSAAAYRVWAAELARVAAPG